MKVARLSVKSSMKNKVSFVAFVIYIYIYIYIDKSHMTTNLLVYGRLNSNSLERVLRLNVPEHSTTIEIAKLGQKHIMSLLSDEKRKRTRTYIKQ